VRLRAGDGVAAPRGVPPLGATLLVLLVVVTILAGSAGSSSAVRGQWGELSTQAQQASSSSWTGSTLPFSIDQSQIDEWLDSATDFVTSAQFGSGAIAG
jgi:hypothetical protein